MTLSFLTGAAVAGKKRTLSMNITLLIVWLIAVIVFAVAEIVTIQLVAIWFAVGAVCSMVACSFGAPFWVQLLVFGVVSLILLLLTRPLVKRFIKVKHERTNADRLIGRTALVTQRISNPESRGTVTISGVTWTARSADGAEIAEGEKAVIRQIEGSKLIVSKFAGTIS
jgi:Membrane protein implicated in regulation of membrane protease activity